MSGQEANKVILSICGGTCPDEACQSVVGFKPEDQFVFCQRCGQTHNKRRILNVFAIDEGTLGFKSILRTLLLACNPNLKKDSDTVKVNGLSNCHGKLISPLFTEFGMDKVTLKAKPLSELTSKPTFDCGLLGDRNYTICPEHLDVPGFGRDNSGSDMYLSETLKRIEEANGNKEVLVPLHADGDGHCLVHAVSRALTGRNLFWHPLRSHLKRHLIERRATYEMLLADFINASEWDDIINECDPNYKPDELKGEVLGLRNVHIFGLANILKRPIILFDSLAGMKSCGDYSAVFLPSLTQPEDCKTKSGELNSPICIAWSNAGRGHFIPLVGLRNENPPAIPISMLPEVWAVSRSLISSYMSFSPDGSVLITGKLLNENYIQKLVNCMDMLFLEKYGVHPTLVSERYTFTFKKPIVYDMSPEIMSSYSRRSIQEHRLYRCIDCLTLNLSPILPEWLRPGNNGVVYNKAKRKYGILIEDCKYIFPEYNLVCHYDSKKDLLILDSLLTQKCRYCYSSRLRLIQADGTVAYENGDVTPRRSFSNHCRCGYKHFYGGKEYDNPPDLITVCMTWSDRTVFEDIPWFQFESDVSLNSNVYEIANTAVQKHFPGEFGTEPLVRRVVDQLLTASRRIDERNGQAKSSPMPLVYIPDEVINFKEEKVESALEACNEASCECDTTAVTAVIKLPEDQVVKNDADSSVSSNLPDLTDENKTLDLQDDEEKLMFVEAEKDIGSKVMIVEDEKDNTGSKVMLVEEEKDNTGSKVMLVEEEKDNTGSKVMLVEEEKDNTGSKVMLVEEEKDNTGSKVMLVEEEKDNAGSKVMLVDEEKDNTGSKVMLVEEEKDYTVSTSGDSANLSFKEDLRQVQLDLLAQQNEYKLKKEREYSRRAPGRDFVELMSNPDYEALVHYGPNAANIRRAWEAANSSSSADSVQSTFQEVEQPSTTVRIGPGYSVLAPRPGDARIGHRGSRGPRSPNSAHGENDGFVGGGPSRNRGSLSARTRFRTKHRE